MQRHQFVHFELEKGRWRGRFLTSSNGDRKASESTVYLVIVQKTIERHEAGLVAVFACQTLDVHAFGLGSDALFLYRESSTATPDPGRGRGTSRNESDCDQMCLKWKCTRTLILYGQSSPSRMKLVQSGRKQSAMCRVRFPSPGRAPRSYEKTSHDTKIHFDQEKEWKKWCTYAGDVVATAGEIFELVALLVDLDPLSVVFNLRQERTLLFQ